MFLNWVKQRIGSVPKTKYPVEENENYPQPRTAIVNAYTLIAALYCASSAILYYYVVENILLAIVHLLALLSVLTNYLFLIQTKNFGRATTIILATGTAVVLSLFATGGWDNTGYLWPFAYLPFAFFLSGDKTIIKWVSILFCGCLIVVLVHFAGVITVPYSPVALGNYFAALFVFTACILLFKKATFKRDEFLSSNILRNITERKKSEKERALLTAIINSSDDAILSKTLDGIITTWNHGAEIVFGYSAGEIIGKHISLLIPPHLQNEEKEIIEKIRHGKAIEHYETERIKKDGKVIDVSLTISPIKDSYGTITGASKISRDITERKEMERERALLTCIVNSSDDAIVSKTLDGIITTWNHGAEIVFGYSAGEIIGKHISLIIPPHLQNEEKEIIEKIRQGKAIEHYETERIKKDGKVIDVSLTISPIKDSHGTITGASKISRDITERKKVEEQFRKLNEELEQKVKDRTEELESFSYSVSHDLRTPLRAVDGYTRMLEEDYGALIDNEGKRLLKGVQQNTKNMGVLIDDLLAFAKLGRSVVKKSVIDMNQLTESALSEIYQAMPHHAEIKCSKLLPVMADSVLLKQVMTNLLSNAIKYSSKKEKPVIEIKSRKENGELIYSVNDNGAGFDMKYANKLFGVFERLHSNEEFPGTGVGLTIAHQIILKHDGKIWAEATPEVGATFSFSLPDIKS